MKDFNEDLMMAAWNGDKAGLKALLLRPGCDAMSKNELGMTALMGAAWHGHTSCIELLLPVSDALSKNNAGHTASGLARSRGHAQLSSLIDAYTLALGEALALGSLVVRGAPRKKASLRV